MATTAPPQTAGTCRPGDPTEVLRALVERAVLAPSSHNTQPWRFVIDGDRVELRADRTRALPVNDPQGRELVISCGAAWCTVRVAAAAADLALATELLPEGPHSDLLAVATLRGDRVEAGLPGAGLIARRRTYRRAFLDAPVDEDVLGRMRQAAAAEGARLHALGRDGRRTLAGLVAEGDRRLFADRRWRQELAAWLLPRRRGEGLPVPELTASATRFVVSRFDLGARTAGEDTDLLRHSPVLAVLTTTDDDAAAWLRAGQALQRVLLVACDAGLQASYLNQPVQVPDLRPRLAALLPGGRVPQLVLRVGRPETELPAAPRRPLDAVLEVADRPADG